MAGQHCGSLFCYVQVPALDLRKRLPIGTGWSARGLLHPSKYIEARHIGGLRMGKRYPSCPSSRTVLCCARSWSIVMTESIRYPEIYLGTNK